MASSHIGAIILAAGASTRMGQPKQLLAVDGKSLLRHVADAVLASPVRPVVIVLGAQAESIRPKVAGLPVIVVENTDWEEGLAASIRAGVRTLESLSPPPDATLLVLCDQPNLTPAAITRLIDHHRNSGKSIVAARYDGHPGPPALFARRHFPELLALSGHGGAKPLFVRHADTLAMVDLPELSVDLDKPSDYRRFIARRSAKDQR